MAETVLPTPLQVRMAKAALGWSNVDLAKKSGLHRNTINNVEHGKGRKATLALLKVTFEAEGVVFIAKGEAAPSAGEGVRLRD